MVYDLVAIIYIAGLIRLKSSICQPNRTTVKFILVLADSCLPTVSSIGMKHMSPRG